MRLLNFRAYIATIIVCLMLAPQAFAFDINLPGISLGGGITADINLTVFENPSSKCSGGISSLNRTTIFAVHGINSDATVFIPLVDALFNNNPLDELVCRVAVVEMPGHGKSGLPQGGLLFGQMTEDNYANVVINTLDRLAQDEGIRPAAILTHSNGGVVTSLVQQKLSDSGTTIAERFGIEKVTFLAPPPTAPVVWPFQQQRRAQLIFQHECLRQGAFMAGDPCEVLDVTAPFGEITWEDIITVDQPLVAVQYDCDPFTVPIGNPTIPFAPPPGPPQMLPVLLLTCVDPPVNPLGDHIPAGFLGGPAPESLKLNLELLGVPPDQRPVTQAGIFDDPTFSVVSFIDDIVVGPSTVTQNFFNHLSGPTETNKFLIVTGPDANHFMFFFDPVGMLDQMAAADICLIPPPSRAVPTLSEWGLIAMAGILGIVGFMVMRRRKVIA